MIGEDEMPPDPFDRDANNPHDLGLVGEIVDEAALLLDALEEARQRGEFLRAVWCLELSDLRVLVVDQILRDAIRRELPGEEARP